MSHPSNPVASSKSEQVVSDVAGNVVTQKRTRENKSLRYRQNQPPGKVVWKILILM